MAHENNPSKSDKSTRKKKKPPIAGTKTKPAPPAGAPQPPAQIPPAAQPAQSVQKATASVQTMLPTIPTGTFYVNYFDQITQSKVRGLMALCTEIIAKVKPATLYFAISSPGGEVGAGITFYNFLRALPCEIVMHNIGSVDSIATVIFLAGNRRYSCQHSRFLFHGIKSNFPQGAQITTAQLREIQSSMDQDERRIREIVVERSKLTEADMTALFQQGDTKNSGFALEKGIIDDIRDFSLPVDAKVATANLP